MNRRNLDCIFAVSFLFILSLLLSICFHFHCFFQNFVLFFLFLKKSGMQIAAADSQSLMHLRQGNNTVVDRRISRGDVFHGVRSYEPLYIKKFANTAPFVPGEILLRIALAI